MNAFFVKAAVYAVTIAAVEITKAVKAKRLRDAEDAQRFDNAKLVVEVSACTDLTVV